MYGIQVWRNGLLMTSVLNPTGVLDVITSGSGSRTYPAMPGWKLEVCVTQVLVGGRNDVTTATVTGWTVHYSNVSFIGPVLVMVRGV
ncbi:hypothetical protein EAP59_27275 [Salmonella enterica]|nr:hypothetical protein [Salmonella enterica]EAM5856839.1 hypothetical protein [Salmonella enterica]EAQ9999378.1 hypothetical protein [Salmonella enterica]EAS3180290.1 hypothetical protein [Salmonella enterica]OIN36074.1 hypothetical protein AO411_2026885 [Salmonella enterica subsp. enterica serovar Sarajane]